MNGKVIFLFRYVRAEILAGFVNGLFLLFIAFFIFSEAVEVCCFTLTSLFDLFMINQNITVNLLCSQFSCVINIISGFDDVHCNFEKLCYL